MRDMVSEMPKEFEAVFADYKMNLVQVRESDKYIFNHEDVRTVFEITRSIYQEDFKGINRKYKDIKSELAAVVGTITDSPYLIEKSSEKEVLNVCKAFAVFICDLKKNPRITFLRFRVLSNYFPPP